MPRHRALELCTLLLLAAAGVGQLPAAQAVEEGAAGPVAFPAGEQPGGGGALPQLAFTASAIAASFRILQITDLHYGGDVKEDANSDEAQAKLLQAEQPDLVVFTGDMVSGYMCPKPCPPGWYSQRWHQLTAPVRAAGVPYASILGNHDDEADLDRRAIVQLDIETGAGLSLTRQGPPNITGASNYWLDIWEPSGASIAARIWLLDTMDTGCAGVNNSWGCVAPDTVAWLNRTATELPAVPSVMFVHIPLPQMLEVWNSQDTVGRKEEVVACPAVDSGLFSVAKQHGIAAIFCGHNHNDEYEGLLDGVVVGFGRKSGYGSYGPPKGWLHGARVIELRASVPGAAAAAAPAVNMTTWIRQEDGSQVFQEASKQPKKKQDSCANPHEDGFWDNGTAVLLVLGGTVVLILAGTAAAVMVRRQRSHKTLAQPAAAYMPV